MTGVQTCALPISPEFEIDPLKQRPGSLAEMLLRELRKPRPRPEDEEESKPESQSESKQPSILPTINAVAEPKSNLKSIPKSEPKPPHSNTLHTFTRKALADRVLQAAQSRPALPYGFLNESSDSAPGLGFHARL